MGESSRDSAIISVDREIEAEPSSSATTEISYLPSTVDPHIAECTSEEGSSTIPAESKPGSGEASQRKKSEGQSTSLTTIIQKMVKWSKIAALFFKSCIISATAKLNAVSRDYRYVSRRLKIEIRALKQSCPGDDIATLDQYPERKKCLLQTVSRITSSSFDKLGNMTRQSSSKQIDQAVNMEEIFK